MSRYTRNTTIRDRDRATISRGKPPCAYAHCLFPDQPIDYRAHRLDPLAYTVDHIIPLNKGGPDTIANKQPMHRACNRHKSDTVEGLHYLTVRDWWTRL